MKTPFEKYQDLLEEVEKKTLACGRKKEDVLLLPVSKNQPIEKLKEFIEHQIPLGENRVQELSLKAESCPEYHHWHLVGSLQSNKAKRAIQLSSLIHSIDTLELLEKMEKEAASLNVSPSALIQINTSQEKTKHGFSLFEVEEWLPFFLNLRHINISGLMTIGPLTQDRKSIERAFASLKRLHGAINPDFGGKLKTLSFGMSFDFLLAIEMGSTLVRVGSRIFS